MPESEKVDCPVCKREARVNQDGRLRKHKARLSTPYRIGVWCKNTNPRATVKADGAANGGRLTTPAGSGKAPSPVGSKLPSRPTPKPRRQFDAFKERVLSNPTARAGFEDAQSRNNLIDALIGLRRAKGLSQEQVAQSIGVNQGTVSQFETESSDPRLSTLQRYARAVDADLILELRTSEPEGVSNVASATRGNA